MLTLFSFLKKHLPADRAACFHYFNTHFYSKIRAPDSSASNSVMADRYENVRKWTNGVSLFDQKVVLIPINLNAHWSLVALLHPGVVCDDSDEDTNESPCLLFFDSLRIHNQRQIRKTIYQYLALEWKTRKHSDRVFDETTFPCFTPNIPKQLNSYDCGVYVLLFGRLVLQQFPFGSTKKQIKDSFPVLCPTAFQYEDVKKFRDYLKQIVYLVRQLEKESPNRDVVLDDEILDFEVI